VTGPKSLNETLRYYGSVDDAVNNPAHPVIATLLQESLICRTGKSFHGYPVLEITDAGREALANL